MRDFRISWWDDIMTNSSILRISDEAHYVELSIPQEALVRTDNLKALKRESFQKLCDQWESKYGERIYAYPPPEPGTAWTISTVPPVIEGEIVQGELPWSDPNSDPLGDMRRLSRDARKAITDR
jgi:hypothetical protein